ncbi:hypothetical protein GWK47_031508 [Chionoecetes opilio]|uniref:Uncharacterized protein n=1 Tax=Chionoecetes opilio TaxID=41210 RepID=A0A8J5CQK1_CHIOP|nr:hypothetical protein GWK47_031508 [Chionoecetes opilio]
MVLEWMSPLVTSALRLVVITMLFAANCGAMCHTVRLPRYKGISHKWITILTILILNLTYLSTVWAPFTITTFKHNLQDLPKPAEGEGVQAPSTYILEYLSRRNGSVVQETKLGTVIGETTSGHLVLPEGKGPQALITIGFDQLRELEHDLAPPPPPQHRPSRLGDALNQWITNVQDLVTSSFTYSLILTAVVWKVMAEKGVMVGWVPASLCSFLLAFMPIPLTLATRGLANTTHHFALHTSEVAKRGYTMYSIICDVHITQVYVVGVFLECTLVLLLATLLLVVMQRRVKYSATSQEEEQTCDTVRVEEVACKFVLLLGAGWAWPLKPVLVTILFCIHGIGVDTFVSALEQCGVLAGQHGVAVPVVFVPLAVFLSRSEPNSCTEDYDTFVDDPEIIEILPEDCEQCAEKEVQTEVKEDSNCKLVVKVEGMSPVEKAFVSSIFPRMPRERESSQRKCEVLSWY